MNKGLLISCALLALAAPKAFAYGGLDLTVVACNTNTKPPPSTTDPGTPQTVFACFQVTTTLDSVVGLDADLRLAVDDPSLPDWWYFGTGGCNEGGVSISLVPSPSLCVGATNPWGTEAVGGVSYLPKGQNPSPGIGFFAVATVPTQTSFTLNPGNYFAFELNFFSDNAAQSGGACAGCGIGAVLWWKSAVLATLRADAPQYLIAGPGLVGDCLQWGSGVPCGVVPTRNRTWGQLKSLYR